MFTNSHLSELNRNVGLKVAFHLMLLLLVVPSLIPRPAMLRILRLDQLLSHLGELQTSPIIPESSMPSLCCQCQGNHLTSYP